MCIHYEHKYCIQLTLEKPLFPIQFHYSTVFYLFLGVADSYIQISSGFVQLATIENTELDKYVEFGPRQANLVLIAYASSEGSGEPAHLRSLARTFAARSHKQWDKRNLQTESQIPGPSEWLGMRSLSWRNARRHTFAWRGSYKQFSDN